MTIYIEDAVFDSLIINFIILFLTTFSLRQKKCLGKILFASSVGCVFSLALTFIHLSTVFAVILKLCCGLIMSIVCLEKLNFKNLILFFIVFVSFTFLMGGFCFFIVYLFGGEIYSIADMTYDLPIGLGWIFILLGLYVYFLIKAIQSFYNRQKICNFFYQVIVCYKNKKVEIKAYLDSGNLLTDRETGLPILIINYKTFDKIFKDNFTISDMLCKNLDKKIKGRYIDFLSVSSNGKMFVFEPSQVYIKEKNTKKEIKVLIGLSLVSFSSQNFEALLSPLAI